MSLPRLALFGATGSIGQSTLEVLRANPGRYQLAAISGHNNIERLAELAAQWRPQWVIVTDKAAYSGFVDLLGEQCPDFSGEIVCGAEYLDQVAADSSISTVVAAVVGCAGLRSSFKALSCGKNLLVANKEPLIAVGELLLAAARRGGGRIIPLDSEHSGAWQCLGCPPIPMQQAPAVKTLILTASGGPFLDWDAQAISTASAEQACRHPNWSMGRKISVDSATLMNKGLELIEASRLFMLESDQLDVVIHRQSIVHALVEYNDGSMLAQMSQTSMKVPVAKALGFPDLLSSDTPPLNLAEIGALQFETPDAARFPCLALARDALLAGGDMPLRLNAANEVAVAHFLAGGIDFGQIAELVDRAMQSQQSIELVDLETAVALDSSVRENTHKLIRELN